jgi:hypothetical protein
MRDGVIASWTDGQVLDRIQRLAWEAHGLYARNSLDGPDGERLRQIRTELDRCWSLLRQRLALPDEGRDGDGALAPPPETVASYEG